MSQFFKLVALLAFTFPCFCGERDAEIERKLVSGNQDQLNYPELPLNYFSQSFIVVRCAASAALPQFNLRQPSYSPESQLMRVSDIEQYSESAAPVDDDWADQFFLDTPECVTCAAPEDPDYIDDGL